MAAVDVSKPCRPTPNGTLEAVCGGGAECVCRRGRDERAKRGFVFAYAA